MRFALFALAALILLFAVALATFQYRAPAPRFSGFEEAALLEGPLPEGQEEIQAGVPEGIQDLLRTLPEGEPASLDPRQQLFISYLAGESP